MSTQKVGLNISPRVQTKTLLGKMLIICCFIRWIILSNVKWNDLAHLLIILKSNVSV